MTRSELEISYQVEVAEESTPPIRVMPLLYSIEIVHTLIGIGNYKILVKKYISSMMPSKPWSLDRNTVVYFTKLLCLECSLHTHLVPSILQDHIIKSRPHLNPPGFPWLQPSWRFRPPLWPMMTDRQQSSPCKVLCLASLRNANCDRCSLSSSKLTKEANFITKLWQGKA